MTAKADLCTLRELYALDGLTTDERAEFEQHLATCAECQAELADYKRVTDLLLYDFDQVDPPEGLRARVLDRLFVEAPVGTSPRVAPTQRYTADPVVPLTQPSLSSSASPRRSAADQDSTVVSSWTTTSRSSSRRRRPWWPVAAGIVTAASLAWAITLQVTHTTPVPVQPEAATPVGSVLLTTSLAAQSVMANASAKVWVSQSGSAKNMLLQFAGLAPVKGSQVYQIWLVRKVNSQLQVYSAGVFTPNHEGRAIFAFQLPRSHYSLVAVTLEPKAIDKTPLGPKVLLGAVSV
ncbi:MAG: anti-sigma factor [Firmicutes bacterium]|nr:anti-sigma factor [Bacillota bacterium]